MTEEQKALAALMASFIDLLNGYSVQELHESTSDTIERALRLLPESVRGEFDVPGDDES